MSFNSIFNPLLQTSFILIFMLSSCESIEHRNDDAFGQVKEDKFITGDSAVNNTIIIQESKKTEPLKKNENQDEWLKFRTEIEKRILKNENKIKEMTQLKGINSKLLKRVEGLARDNNDLRSQLNDFEEEIRVRKEKFKMEMDHDVNQVGIDLTGISEEMKK